MNINFTHAEIREIKRVFSNELTDIAEKILRKLRQAENGEEKSLKKPTYEKESNSEG